MTDSQFTELITLLRETMPGWPAAMSASDAASYCGLGRRTFDRLVAADKAPQPVALHAKLRRWRRTDLESPDHLGSGHAWMRSATM